MASHPWMVHGWHNNSDIHGYLDRGGKARWPAIHGWSMEDHSNSMASTDTLTDGVRQGVHSWDGPRMVSNCGHP